MSRSRSWNVLIEAGANHEYHTKTVHRTGASFYNTMRGHASEYPRYHIQGYSKDGEQGTRMKEIISLAARALIFSLVSLIGFVWLLLRMAKQEWKKRK
jgi:hypothetical protein